MESPFGHAPQFLIIGAMKAGSTSLSSALGSMPDVFIPLVKEPHFLCNDDVYVKGAALYANLFRGRREGQLCGDASTGYSKLPGCPGVAERARRFAGERLPVIYIVRDPIQRALSHHYHLYRSGRASADVDQAIADKPSLTNYGRYMMQLTPWVEEFGREQIHVVIFEEYLADALGELARVRAFLGLENQPLSASRVSTAQNRGEEALVSRSWFRRLTSLKRTAFYKTQVRARIPNFASTVVKSLVLRRPAERPAPPRRETIERLRESLEPDAAGLQQFLGRDKPIWNLEDSCGRQ